MADEDVLTFEQLKNLQNKEQDSDTLQELDKSFFDRVKDYLDRKQRIGGHLNNKEYRNAKHIVEDILDARQKKIIRLAFLATKSQITVDNLLPEEELLFDRVQESIKEHRSEIEDQLFGDDKDPAADKGQEEAIEQQNDDRSDEEAGQDESEEDSGEELDEETEEDETMDDGTVEQEDGTDEAESDEGSEADEEAETGDDTAEDADDENGEELLFGSDDSDEEGGTDDGDEEAETGDQEDTEEADGEELVEVRMTADVTEFMGVDLQPYGPFDEGETAEIPAENAEVLEEQGKAERQD